MASPRLPSVYNLVTFEAIGSTNDEARALARQGEEIAPDGTLVWALEQTAGRGRRGREWHSPKGNLYISLILRPEVPTKDAAQLSFVAALGLYDALGTLSDPGHQIHLKWPNDILLQDQKVAGLLLETESSGEDHADWVIVGLGLNVASFPEDMPFPATSLCAENWAVSVEDTLQAFSRSFLGWANRWVNDGFAPIRQTWLMRAKGLNKPIEVRLENETLKGTFIDLDEDGALLLDQDGKMRRIAAGDVYFSEG